jgi:hypothetical protein
MLALITEVAQSYLELVELDRRLAVARDSRDAFEATHTLFSKRYGATIVSRWQVTHAEAALAAVEESVRNCWRGGPISARPNRISERHRRRSVSRTQIYSRALD